MRWIWVLIAVGALASLAAGDNGSHESSGGGWRRELARLAPALEPELVRHLVFDPEPEWLAYCRRVGLKPLGDALGTMSADLRNADHARFLERREPLERASLRIARACSQIYGFSVMEADLRLLMAMTPEQDFERRRLERAYMEVGSDRSLTSAQRWRIVDSVRAMFQAIGDTTRLISAHLVLALVEQEMGRRDRSTAQWDTVADLARRQGQAMILCQALLSLGYANALNGQEDSMRLRYDEAIAVARRYALLETEARSLHRYSMYYAQHGRLALSLEYLAEEQRVSEQPGGEAMRLRQQLGYLWLLAELGCWDLVESGLRRLPPLFRALPRRRGTDSLEFEFGADRLRARLAYATGDTAMGSSLMGRWSKDSPLGPGVGLARLYADWSQCLESVGDRLGALEICQRGLACRDTVPYPALEFPMLMRRARLFDSLGRIAEAGASLDSAEVFLHANVPEHLVEDREIAILRARIAYHGGHPVLARRLLGGILREFSAWLRGVDGAPIRLVELDDALWLRDAAHEIQGFQPAEGYRFELAWRSLSQTLRPSARRGLGTTPAHILAPEEMASRPGVHLVYHFTQDALLRWTATQGRVVLDTIPHSANQWLAEISEAVRLLQTEPPAAGHSLGPRTARKLERIASALLPESLAGAGPHPMPLYVTADGPLLALPFEALPAKGPQGVEPLARWADVAYVRGWSGARRRADGHAVIVSDPMPPPELRRRHVWAPMLAGSRTETEAARARWPGAVVLAGEQATKTAVLSTWRRASIIYLTSHHLRDSSTPFTGFVPLAAPEGAPPHAAILEGADLQSLDLSACRLVVLATCSSGTPYRLSIRPGPSLGDAFLDAGAHAVVQSFWDVDDHESSAFMRAFLATWHEDRDDAAALGEARRRIMATPEGAVPRVWAAWSVQTALPGGSERLASVR